MAKLHDELGLPPDQPLSRVEMLTDPWFGKSWADWRYEAFGIFVSNDVWGPTARPPWPALRIEADDGAAPITLQAWLQLVWRNDALLGIERRWHPARGQRDFVAGLELPHTTAQRTQVWHGLDLLNLAQKHPGGAPKGPRKGRSWTRRRILNWWREATEAYSGDGDTPTLKDLAQAMGVKDPETARQRVRDAELSWPPE